MNFKKLGNGEVVEVPDLRGVQFTAGENSVYMEGDFTKEELLEIVAEMEKYSKKE